MACSYRCCEQGMQIVFCPRTGRDGCSATGMTSSLPLVPGAKRRGRQYSRAARLTWTSDALPEIRDEQQIYPLGAVLFDSTMRDFEVIAHRPVGRRGHP